MSVPMASSPSKNTSSVCWVMVESCLGRFSAISRREATLLAASSAPMNPFSILES